MKKLPLLLILCGLTACVQGNQKYLTDPQAAQESVKCEVDKFNNVTTCTTGRVTTYGTGKNTYSLLDDDASVAENGADTESFFRKIDDSIQIYTIVKGFGGAPDVYDVLDDKGKGFKFRYISIDLHCTASGCIYSEHTGIDIDKAYIEKHAKTGIKLKVYGRKHRAFITLPPAYVQGFNNYLKKK